MIIPWKKKTLLVNLPVDPYEDRWKVNVLDSMLLHQKF